MTLADMDEFFRLFEAIRRFKTTLTLVERHAPGAREALARWMNESAISGESRIVSYTSGLFVATEEWGICVRP